jgi:hypothetical protein
MSTRSRCTDGPCGDLIKERRMGRYDENVHATSGLTREFDEVVDGAQRAFERSSRILCMLVRWTI